MVVLDIVVTDGEEGERAIRRELRVAVDHGGPCGLHGAALGKLEVHLLPPGDLTIPGEQVDPDTHDDV
jgi:hypothetical protein